MVSNMTYTTDQDLRYVDNPFHDAQLAPNTPYHEEIISTSKLKLEYLIES